MENKALKKILVMAIVFVMIFSNCGFTLQALATSDGISIFGFTFFSKDRVKYKAYFLNENGKEVDEMQADVNGEMTLVLELEPKETGYLKEGTIKAVTDEGDPNFEFKEILNLSENKEEEKAVLEQTVQLEKTLLKTEQVMNTELPRIELANPFDDENVTVENTVTSENSVESTNTVENNMVETVSEEISAKEEDALIDEKVAYEEEAKEKESTEVRLFANSNAKVISSRELLIENIVEATKVYVKLAYKSNETVKASDLCKETHLELQGTFINKDLEEIEVIGTDKITTEWTYSKDIIISSEITKVSPFEVEGTKGTILESKIVLNRNCEEEKYLPVKESVIEVEAPKINGKAPEKLEVSASKLKATVGEEINDISFSSNNWKYDTNSNTITIKIENPDGVLTSGEDIYNIVYRYADYVESEEITVDIKGTVTVEEYSGKNNNIITKSFSDRKTIVVNIGELITYSIGTTEDSISRGRINANYNSVEAVYETEFTSTVGINILTNDVLKEFTLKDTKEFYIDKSNLEFEAQDVKYKIIKFKYDEIIEILNQGGIIEIKANTGELLYLLDKYSVRTPSDCEIALGVVAHGVEISVKDIKVNGTITVDFVKSIGKCAYEKFAFNNFEKIESRIKAEVKYGTSDEIIELTPLKTEKYFEKSYTKAEISMNKESLATILDNENVEFKIELNNNSEESDLYINPEFEVVFPSYIKQVEVKAVNLVYEEGLTVKNISIFKDNNNIQRMKISLEGVQRTFSTSDITNGTNIIINTKIVVDDYTPQKKDQLKMYYYNLGVTNYQAQTDWKISSSIPEGIIRTTNGYDVEVFEFEAPSGFVTANGIENYDGLGSTIDTVKQGTVTATLAMGETSRPVTMNLAALNNTGNKCTDVVMLGRIPHKEATDVITGQKTGTNTNTQLLSEIIQDPINPIGCDIYYSYNANANSTLSNGANGWIKKPEDMSQVKSFLIVPTSKVEPGTLFKFSYTFQVPANLPYDVEMYGSFGAFYNNFTDLAVVYESTKADLVGLVTDSGPRIDAVLSVDIGNGAKILSAKRMKYILTVVNSGSIEATNIKATIPIPNNTTYIARTESCVAGDYGYMLDSSKQNVEFQLDLLNPGETKTFEFYVKAGRKERLDQYADGKDAKGYYKNKKGGAKEYITEVPAVFITNKATVTTDIMANAIESNEVSNELIYANFDTSITLDYDRVLLEDSETNFQLVIDNISGKELKNVVAVFDVGQVYKYVSGTIDKKEGDITFDANEGKIYFRIPEMTPEHGGYLLKCKLEANKIQKGKEECNCKFEIMADGMTSPEYSTAVYQCIKKGIIEARDNTINPKKTIKEKETIIISTEIRNIGEFIAKNCSFECEVPNNMEIVSVTCSNKGLMSNGNGSGKIVDTIQSLDVGEVVTIDMKLKAKNMKGTDPIQVVLNRIVKQKGQEDIRLEPYVFMVLNTEKTESEVLEEENKKLEEEEKKRKEEEEKNKDVPKPSPSEEKPAQTTPEEPKPTETPKTEPEAPKVETPKKEEPKVDKPVAPTTPNKPEEKPETKPEESQEEPETFTIKGTAWLDENKNGAREDGEKRLSSIKVYLLTVGHTMLKSTTTNNYGDYKFDGVENGKYIIAFSYDTNLYVTTIYRKADVGENINSDVIESNSEEMNAISNTITVENGNVENIDIGLQDRDVFDLQMSKLLRKIVVKTKKGTKEYKYNDKDLAKIDIHSREINGAQVELEYVILLENKGSVPGYAEQVIDYIGNDIEFNEAQNPDWYRGNDGYIYMKNVSQNTLNPGQKKEYSLCLVKTMTSENTGTVSNKAEILQALSNSAEKEQADNNVSVQNTIITVATGKTAQNIIIIFVLAILAGLVYKGKLPVNIHFNKIYKTKDKKISLKKFYR